MFGQKMRNGEMDKKRIAQLFRQLANEFESGGIVEPTQPIVNNPEPIQPAPQPKPDIKTVELSIHFVNVNFAKGEYIDVNVNGVWYNLSQYNHESPEWDIKVYGSRGVVLKIPNEVKTISFRDSQIRRPGLLFNGIGYFSYKIGARPIDFNLKHPVESPESHPNFWARWYRQPTVSGFNEYADLVSANGSISGRPEAKIDNYSVPPEWNVTGKMSLILGMVGRNEWS